MSLPIYEVELLRGGGSINGAHYDSGDIVRGVVNGSYFIILNSDLSWGAWIDKTDVKVLKAVSQ